MFPLGIFLANAAPMFEKNLLNPFGISILPVTFLASSLNWVRYCEPFSFLLITVFSIFQVSFMFILFSSKILE